NVLRRLQDLPGARAAYEKAIALEPTCAIPYNGLGNTRLEQGDLAGARAAFEKAIELDPRYASPHNGLRNVLWPAHQPVGAGAAYGKAIELAPTLPQPHLLLGQVLLRTGRFNQALASFQRAHTKGARLKDVNLDTARLIQETKRLMGLSAQLPEIHSGRAKP